MPAPYLLTTARESLWTAINGWPSLKTNPDDVRASVFAQAFTFDDEMVPFEELEPSISEFPAIAIAPTVLDPSWYLNQMQNWRTVYQITIWTADWSLPQPEGLIEEVINAIYRQMAAGTTVPVVKQQTGFYPYTIGPFTFAPVRVGEGKDVKAMRVQQTITLRQNKDPIQGP